LNGEARTARDSNTLKHGGGNLWTPMSLDVEKGLLHVPVGNPQLLHNGQLSSM
jgi:glucose dehydrogenase